MPFKNWPPPQYPLVHGDHNLTAYWKLYLPEPFARRIEDSSLVLWRPGLTFWLAAWGNDHNESQAERLAQAKRDASPARFSEREATANGIARFSYRLRDVNDSGSVESVHSLAFADEDALQSSAYFDDPADEAEAWQIVDSIMPRKL